jgi:transcriptional regulator with XRE-family HTH domain
VEESQRWVEFGRWLTEQRELAGLRRREAAKRSKLSEPIGGIRLLPNPSLEVLERVAKALGVPMEEVMKRVGRPPTPPRRARAQPDAQSAVLAQKVARLAQRDRQLVELLVDAMLDHP